VTIALIPFLLTSILGSTFLVACADPEILRRKASEEISASCEHRGCLEPLLLEVIVNGNLRQYKEFHGIPADPEPWEYIFPTGRHARALEEFSRLKLAAISTILGVNIPHSAPDSREEDDLLSDDQGYDGAGLLGRGFLGPYTPNAYGPGMNMDATGRPFIWRPEFGGPALGPVTPNAYGPGVGMDATGRPVRPTCPPGWAGSC
jgi:hypothetical protein